MSEVPLYTREKRVLAQSENVRDQACPDNTREMRVERRHDIHHSKTRTPKMSV